jgi:hypothetical protein
VTFSELPDEFQRALKEESNDDIGDSRDRRLQAAMPSGWIGLIPTTNTPTLDSCCSCHRPLALSEVTYEIKRGFSTGLDRNQVAEPRVDNRALCQMLLRLVRRDALNRRAARIAGGLF